MKVKGTQYVEVTIRPVDVIEKLVIELIGVDKWIEEKDGKNYIMEEVSAGQRSMNRRMREISNEDLLYYHALGVVRNHLLEQEALVGENEI